MSYFLRLCLSHHPLVLRRIFLHLGTKNKVVIIRENTDDNNEDKPKNDEEKNMNVEDHDKNEGQTNIDAGIETGDIETKDSRDFEDSEEE